MDPKADKLTYTIAALITVIGLIVIWNHPKYDNPPRPHAQAHEELPHDHP